MTDQNNKTRPATLIIGAAILLLGLGLYAYASYNVSTTPEDMLPGALYIYAMPLTFLGYIGTLIGITKLSKNILAKTLLILMLTIILIFVTTLLYLYGVNNQPPVV